MENKESLIRKAIYFSISIIVLIGVLIGSIFGLLNYNSSDDYSFNSTYKQKYEIEINANLVESDKDIEFVSEYISETLEFFELFNSDVDIIDDENILVTFPLENFKYNDFERYSLDKQSDFGYEILSNILLLINTSKIEFRTPEGELLIDESGNFIEPATEETETGTESFDSRMNLPDTINTYDFDLIKNSWVDYDRGYPIIKFIPEDQAESAFRDGATYLYSSSTSTDESGNVVDQNKFVIWFGYDVLTYIVNEIDPEGFATAGNNLLTYIYMDENGNTLSEPKDIAKPFFVTVGSVPQEPSVYTNEFSLYGNLSVNDARNAVRRINFSNEDINLSVSDASMVYNEFSFKSVSWVWILFITIIILIAFFFMYWFGLLGLIASVLNTLIALVMVSIVSIFSIPLSLSLLYFSMILAVFAFTIEYIFIKQTKNNIDINKSTFTKFKENLLESTKIVLPTSFVFLIITGILGLLLISLIQVIFYLLLFGIVISIIFVYGLLVPILFLMDFMFGFSNIKSSRKWDIVVGVTNDKIKVVSNLTKNYEDLNFDSKQIKMFSIFGLILMVITFGFFGIFGTINGSIVNTTANLKDYYKYDIVRVEDTLNLDRENLLYEINNYEITNVDYEGNLSEDELINYEVDRYNQKMFEKQTMNDWNEINNFFEQYNVKVVNYELKRFEHYDFTVPSEMVDGTDEYKFLESFSFGFSIYTTSKIDLELIDSIEETTFSNNRGNGENIFSIDEDENATSITDKEDRITNYEYHYIFQSSSSLEDVNNIDEQKIINNNYSETNNIMKGIYSFILLLIIIFIVLLVLFNLPVAISTVFSLLVETFVYLGVTTLFFIPFSQLFFGMFFTISMLSIISKISLVRKKDRDIKFNFKSLLFLQFVLVINLLFSIILLGFFGMEALIIFVISLLSLFVIPGINIMFFVPIVKIGNELKNKRKEEQQNSLEWQSEQDDVISEEFIEGINK